jgi:hypothetical protein
MSTQDRREVAVKVKNIRKPREEFEFNCNALRSVAGCSSIKAPYGDTRNYSIRIPVVPPYSCIFPVINRKHLPERSSQHSARARLDRYNSAARATAIPVPAGLRR